MDVLCETCGRIAHKDKGYGSRQAYCKKDSLADRFWKYVDKTGECWIWRGHTSNGYGRLTYHRQHLAAHHVAWELEHGPIPAGMWVLHTCEANYPIGDDTHRRCVRHLKLGTHMDNMRDMATSGRQACGWRNGAYTKPERKLRGASHPLAKFSNAEVLAIRAAAALPGFSQKEIARHYHVRRGTIFDITSGLRYVDAVAEAPQ